MLRHLTTDEAPTILLWSFVATVGIAFLLEFGAHRTLGPIALVRTWIIGAVAAFCLRGLARYAYRRITPCEKVLIVGSGAVAQAAIRKLALFRDIHATVVGQVDANNAAEAERAACLDGVERVIVATDSLDEETIAVLVRVCRRERLKLTIMPPARGVFGTAVLLTNIADLAVIEYNTWPISPSTLVLKRAIDLLGSTMLLVLFSPLLVVVAIAVKLDSRGPVFFVQRRAGQDGHPFRMVKFRSMSADAEERLKSLVEFEGLDQPMFKFEHDPRVTRVGRLLRRTSLDEAPQLFNVLAGQMSLVGPRPEQVELVERYAPEHRFRLAVKPGLTGPMQVYGRGALAFEERLAVEREYIENLTVGRDLRILLETISPVFTGHGAY